MFPSGNVAMFLKTLELFGFKSFADRTVVQFHEGITAIVGPNGCGKSNILDAVKWVLGEQSAKALRGEGMVDVIFNGTDDRKPLNLAEISLTFADCERDLGVDWNEVRVTRRLYRDGRSEYSLNNAPCRLRDIHNLFMDTGIGRSAYSIMEQGKIDQVLSSRPEERRAVFEEAAGITKYKTQKREALRKLEHTEANLLRGEDILREVKRQIASLQRQASKARRYRALQSDLQILDTHLSKRRFESLDEERCAAEQEIERLTEATGETTALIQAQEVALVAKRLNLEEIELRASGARERAQELRSQMANGEARVGFNRERIIEAEAIIRRHGEEIAEAEHRIAERRGDLEKLEAALHIELEVVESVERELAEQAAAADHARKARTTAESAFDRLRSSLAVGEQKIFKLRNELASFVTQKEGIDARLAALEHEVVTLEDALQRSREREEFITQACADRKQAIQVTTKALQLAQDDASRHVQRLRSKEEEVAGYRRELQAADLRREALEQLNREGAGLADSAQALLEAAAESPALSQAALGALSNFIEVRPEHISAVEAALGEALNAIAARDRSALQELISALPDVKAQGATLFVPGHFPMQQTSETSIDHSGSQPLPVSELISVGGPLGDYAKQLLANTWLVPRLADAIQCREQKVGTFVSIDGDLVAANGMIKTSPGASGEQSILQRKAQIAALSTRATDLRSTLHRLEEEHKALAQDLAASQERVETEKAKLQEMRLEAGGLEGQLGEVKRERGGLEQRLSAIRREREQNLDRQKGILDRHESSAGLVAQEEALVARLGSEIAESMSAVESARAEQEMSVNVLNDLRIKAAEAKQRVEGLRNQQTPLKGRIAELEATIANRRKEVAEYTDRISSHRQENMELEQAIERQRHELAEVDKRITEIISEREKASEEIAEVEKAQRDLRARLDALRGDKSEHELRLARAKLHVNSLRDHVASRYALEIHEFHNDTYSLLKTLESVRKQQSRRSKELVGETEGTESERTTQPSAEELPADERVDTFSEAPSPDDTVSEAFAVEKNDPPIFQANNTIDWDEVERLVVAMRQRLDGMGPVNLDAIEEFEELEERQAFLDQQHTDLVNAKVELLEAITRINKTTEDLFSETFQRLRENFQIMFRELFGGGRADLALMDSEDPLECGIEVIARPPGKQPQSISLLSGGERAMTALALLFAIYMVKPSPFCVLDEMDAPLDDSNISRFIRILERFTTQSQFVVISHNKRTIARSDYLYGVTMEQKGISKLIGIRFSRSDSEGALADETPGISESIRESSDEPVSSTA